MNTLRLLPRSVHDVDLPLLTAPARPPSRPMPRRWSTKALLCALLLVSVGSCIYCVKTAFLVLTETEPTIRVHAEQANDASSTTSQPPKLQAASELVESTTNVTTAPIIPLFDPLTDGDYSEYTCVGWRQTGGCSPDGEREPEHDQPCDVRVRSGMSGFCEVQHATTGARRRVLPTHCTATYRNLGFECNSFGDLLTYGRKALTYVHDRNFSCQSNQRELLNANGLDQAPYKSFFERGISMVIYDELVPSAYASVRWLRSIGSALPVEMWYRRTETNPDHPLLKKLVANYSVYLREFDHPLATRFFTKLYAVFYTAFDSVLLLDADNFAVKDPTYLFDTPEFASTGAIFWPDFWKPDHTLFNVHNKSLVWPVFDLEFVDMFEQESGQVLINRRRHFKALNALMYYGFTLPRIHQELRLIWGDKDLFRFAWMKTKSSFEMIARPPGSAGILNTTTGAFCGLTMVQHDPQGEILFLHRNMEKIATGHLDSVWTHIQQFKPESPLSEYRISWSKQIDAYPSCWGLARRLYDSFTLKSMASLGLGEMESTLLRFANESVNA